MFDSRKRCVVFAAFALIMCVLATCGLVHHSSDIIELQDELYARSEEILAKYSAGNTSRAGRYDSSYVGDRLSQRVTVINENGLMPIGGNISKCDDEFYPDTYEVTFSRNAIFSTSARVYVRMDVEAGETVYVLTGNKDNGYSERAVVRAVDDDLVVFDTNVIRDYTISKTDISGAQEAIRCLLASNTLCIQP